MKWNSVVLSFSFPSKKINDENDPITQHQYRLEPLDIKTIQDYTSGKTTHVVASRRNTAKGLQALVNAKPIVTDSFIDALVTATTPVPNTSDLLDPKPSPLEQDFDANWPDAALYLPDAGKEPTLRPPEAYNPKLERGEVFAGFTFVFLDSGQFDALQAPINDGHGKALIYELNPGQTTLDQVIEYITNVSGYKDINELQGSNQHKKGVVVVRLRPKGEWSDWMTNLQQRVDVKLGLRSVEQNEFLDAILQNDASPLRRPLEDGEESESQKAYEMAPDEATKPPSIKTSSSDVNALDHDRHQSARNNRASSPIEPKVPPSSASEREQPTQAQQENAKPSEATAAGPTRRRGRRGIVTSRFTGFDDFGASQSVQDQRVSEQLEPSQPQSAVPAKSTRSQTSTTHPPAPGPRIAVKRSLSPSPDPEAAVDELLPGAAAMKRRRLERSTPAVETGGKRKASDDIKDESSSNKKSKIKVEDVDYNALLRSRREAEDEAARQDQEALKEALAMEGLSVEDMKNLVQVEELEIPVRSRSFNDNDGGESHESPSNGRWDERWNGRKNFKGFKRRGQNSEPRQRRHKVFVPTEEVQKKSFGLGEEYWGGNRDTHNDTQRSNKSQRETQDRDDGDSSKFRRRRDAVRKSRQEDEDRQVAEDIEPEEVIQPTRNDRVGRRAMEKARERDMAIAEESESTQHPTQTLRAETQTKKSKGKRPAREEPEPAPMPKRQSRLDSGRRAAQQEDEGDAPKFKFRRRKKD